MTILTGETLARLNSGVAIPRYDRRQVTTGIVHIGVGGFHRSHEATDVEPYDLMKLRLLNASHQALCYPGYLAGYLLVHEVTTDPLFARFLLDYMTAEAIPTLKPVPGIDLHQTLADLDQYA